MKKKLQRFVRPTLRVLAVAAVVVTLGFVERSSDRLPIHELVVSVDAPEGVHFIDDNAVRQQVLASSDAVIGMASSRVDVPGIEEGLRALGCVAKANVFQTMDGALHVEVEQRRPIARVINQDGSGFYIDRNGWTMPLSDIYTARVLVVTGQLFEPFAQRVIDLGHADDSLLQATRSDEILAVARTIVADPLWNALFDQVVVDASGEFELIPRIGAQRVKVGNGADLDRCLLKLKGFYQQAMAQGDWRMYSVIDMRFADQVVCTRKNDQASGLMTGRSTPTH